MTHIIFDVLLSVFILCYSIHMVYFTYKEPSQWFSTNMKGYIGGGLMAMLSILSIAGKFSLLDIFIDMTRKTLHYKKHQSAIGVLFFLAIILLILALTYFRPDKIQARYQKLLAQNRSSLKLISNSFLFYFPKKPF